MNWRDEVLMEHDGWRPIETAPKDGRTIELYFPLEGLSECWQREVKCWWRDDEYARGWIWEGRSVRGFSEEYQPSHWRPCVPTKGESEDSKIYTPSPFRTRRGTRPDSGSARRGSNGDRAAKEAMTNEGGL